MTSLVVGGTLRGKVIREIITLSNGWLVLKTDDGKSANDFRVKVVYQTKPRIRSITPKHAHFLIDFYGKKCADDTKATDLFWAIIDVWNGQSPVSVLTQYGSRLSGLPGYDPEYILHALNWILEQEDVNFTDRPQKKQQELEETMRKCGVSPLPNRLGSYLAISLFCNVALGMHPVEALIRANLDVIPVKRAKGAV